MKIETLALQLENSEITASGTHNKVDSSVNIDETHAPHQERNPNITVGRTHNKVESSEKSNSQWDT